MGARTRWIGAIAIAFALGILIGATYNRRENSRPESGPRSTAATLIGRDSPGSSTLITINDARPVVFGPVPDSRTPDDIATFSMETLGEPDPVRRFAALSNLLENLTTDNWEEVWKAFVQQTAEHGRVQDKEWHLFLQRAGEVAGKQMAEKLYAENRKEGMRSALTGWAISDPEAAVDWLETVPDPEFRDSVWGAAVRGIAMHDPDLAIRLLEQIEVDRRASYSNNLMSIIVQTAGIDEAAEIFDRAVGRAAANEEVEAGYLGKLFSTLVDRRLRSAQDVDAIESWGEKHLGQPYAMSSFYFKTAEAMARKDPLRAMTFLDNATAAGFDRGGHGAIITGWMETQGPDAIGEWLNANPTNPHRDFLAVKFAGKILNQDPEAAKAWLESVQDPLALEQAPGNLTRLDSDPFAAPPDPFAP